MLHLSAFVLWTIVNVVFSLDILGVFPAPFKSHYYVFEPYMQELATRDHNVTVISYFPEKTIRENLTFIDLSENSNKAEFELPMKRSPITTLLSMTVVHAKGGPDSCKVLLSNENVQRLWKTQRRFDVVVLEQFDSDCALALAYKLGAPVVGVTSHMLLPWHYNRLGVPYNPSYVLFDFFEGGTRPTILQRFQRAFSYNWFYFINKYITQKLEQNIVGEYLGEVPPLEELGSNIKFLLLYQYFILSGSSLLPANIKEVGGYHIKETKPLPNDIERFIEESEHGVIYVSFGSILKSSALTISTLKEIITALSEFPQRVIWKWDKETLPGNPKNIYLSKWLPQNDILAHPKVSAFFSHCGLLGMTEGIHHGVPILCMPIFGDQPSNTAAAEEAGLGVEIHFDDLSKENIVKKLKVLLNPEFKERAKRLSKAWHDRPVSAMDSAIFWTEFAAQHNFTYKSHSAEVPLYQYLCLDTLAILLLVLFVFCLCIRFLISFCCISKFNNRKNKIE